MIRRETSVVRLASIVCLLSVMLTAAIAHADGSTPADPTALRELRRDPTGYARLLGSIDFGKGIRFNNPYRLQSELGSNAESLSTTATYIDFGAAIAFGKPDGLEHGAALHFSTSLSGVSQQVLVPSYFGAYPLGKRALAYARLGPALILSQDFNVGGELAGGFSWFLTSKIAAHGELLGDLFYGANIRDHHVAYPILSAQLGVLVEQEILP